jgi:hypothetical protein
MAHAVKSAYYPVLYEKMKSPREAKKALKNWKKGKKRAPVLEGPGSNRLEGNNRGLIQEVPNVQEHGNLGVVDDTSQPVEDSNAAQNVDAHDFSNSGHANRAAHETSNPEPLSSPLAPNTSNMLVVRNPINLPPQQMNFSDPVFEKTKRGSRVKITCTLLKSYPNFHLECDYEYIDKKETVNYSITEVRVSLARISTRENLWVIAFEKKGYNEDFIKGVVGEAEYARLESEVDGPIVGDSKPGRIFRISKKVNVPEGFDLGGIWCKAKSFYKMLIFVPSDDYMQDDTW